MLSHPNLKKLYTYLLYGLAFLIPSGFYNFEGLLIALLFIVWLVTKQYKVIKDHFNIQSFLLPLFFLFYPLSLIYTNDISSGIGQLTMHLSYLLLPFIFITNLVNDRTRRNILLVFLFSIVLFVLIADVYAIMDIIKTERYIVRIDKGDYYKFLSYGLTRVFPEWHPTLVALFLLFGLVLTVKYLFKAKKVIAICLIIFIVINIFLIKSLIGIICFFAITMLFLFSLIKQRRYKFGAILLFIVVTSTFYLINPFKIDKIQQFKQTKIELTDKQEARNVLSIRLVKWTSTFNLFLENPILGVSPGDLKQNLVDEYKDNGFDFAAERRFGPHNQFLQILASFGIVGFSVFFITLFWPYLKGLEVSTLYFWFLVITLSFFLTEDVLERQQGIVYFSFFYGLIIMLPKRT